MTPLTRAKVTSRPLITPTTRPIPRLIAIATTRGEPDAMALADMTAHSPMFAPTERSNSLQTSGTRTASVAMRRMAWLLRQSLAGSERSERRRQSKAGHWKKNAHGHQ